MRLEHFIMIQFKPLVITIRHGRRKNPCAYIKIITSRHPHLVQWQIPYPRLEHIELRGFNEFLRVIRFPENDLFLGSHDSDRVEWLRKCKIDDKGYFIVVSGDSQPNFLFVDDFLLKFGSVELQRVR
jgi:hypothetical protein